MITINQKERSISLWNGKILFTAREAVQLMEELNSHKNELYELASWYECAECGQAHLNTVKTCPILNITGEEE